MRRHTSYYSTIFMSKFFHRKSTNAAMPERSKGVASGAIVFERVGSNPTRSIFIKQKNKKRYYFIILFIIYYFIITTLMKNE